MNHHAKRLLLASAKWLLSIAALFFVLREMDVAQLGHMLSQQNPVPLLAAVALLVLQAYISTFRWQHIICLLKADGLQGRSIKNLFSLNYISMFFNCCLPGTVGGDVLRALMLRSATLPISLATHSVIIDRLFAVMAIFVMVGLSMPWLAPMFSLGYAWVGMALIAAGFVLLKPVLAYISALLTKRVATRVTTLLKQFIDSMAVVIASPLTFLRLLAQAVFAHGLFCLSVYAIAVSLSVPFSAFDSLLLIPTMLLVSLLPISVGGWGVRELSMVYLLARVGVDKEAALMISVQLGIVMMAASLPGLYCWLVRKKGAL